MGRISYSNEGSLAADGAITLTECPILACSVAILWTHISAPPTTGSGKFEIRWAIFI
jgi:hypothetical protein